MGTGLGGQLGVMGRASRLSGSRGRMARQPSHHVGCLWKPRDPAFAGELVGIERPTLSPPACFLGCVLLLDYTGSDCDRIWQPDL